jgi:SAM-dependent methyltransferase
MHGVGFDISDAAVKKAREAGVGLALTFTARSLAGALPVPDASQTLVLDMMTSHFLSASERAVLRDEVFRMLKPGGWFFMKTFLRDGDLHTVRLLQEYGTDEEGTYVHPVIGVREHVYFEDELKDFLVPHFTIHKIYRSHKHISRGQARKRRTISIYAQKPEF